MLIGVIVEFHQVHVYKNNISFWHLMATKTVGKGSKKYVKPITDFVKDLNPGFVAREVRPCGDHAHFQLSEKTIYSRHLFDLSTPEYIYDKVLRGPPTA
jgi:hypothetical protein